MRVESQTNKKGLIEDPENEDLPEKIEVAEESADEVEVIEVEEVAVIETKSQERTIEGSGQRSKQRRTKPKKTWILTPTITEQLPQTEPQETVAEVHHVA